MSAGLAAPAPTTITATDSSNTLGKSVPGFIANVKATEVLQPIKAHEELVKSTPGVILDSSSADKTQIHTSAYPFILEEPHLINAMVSSISILKKLNPDSDFNVNLIEPKSKTTSTIHIINHIHSGKGNVTKKGPKVNVDNFLNNSFDSILSKAILPVEETKWHNSERKSKRINPIRTLSGDNKTEECTNATLPATDKSDKIIDQNVPEDKVKININSESSVNSQANVKDSHKDVTGQTPLSLIESIVSKEFDSSGRKAKVLDSKRPGTESESALVQLQPGHDAPAASQGRVESLSSHVEGNSANQPLESHKSPLEKNIAINKEGDKIQPIVSANIVVTKENQEKKDDTNEDNKSKTNGSEFITDASEKKTLIKDTNVSSASDNNSDLSTTITNVEVGVTPGPIKKKNSSELDRGLIALNVFKQLSEFLNLDDITTNNSIVADDKLISKGKNIVPPQSISSLKNEAETPKQVVSQEVEVASTPSGASDPKVGSQINGKANVGENKETENNSPKVVQEKDAKAVNNQKIDNVSISRGSVKFENNNLSLSNGSKIDGSKDSDLNKIVQPAVQVKETSPLTEIQTKVSTPSSPVKTVDTKVTLPLTEVKTKVTTHSTPLQTVETKVTTPSTPVKTVESIVTTPSTLVKPAETKATTPSAEVKTKDTTASTANTTDKSILVKKLESSTTSVHNSSISKTYQDSNNFRQSSNAIQNKHDENQSINIQAKPLEDNVSNTHINESTINPVTPRQGRGQVTQTPAPTVQWIKITPPVNQILAAKINNDENLQVQEANYLSRAAKNQFQSNNNYLFKSDTRVTQNNAVAETPLEESKFVKIIPTANQGVINTIPKLSQTFESSSEPSNYSSPKYIVLDNTPKSINDKESFSTPGPFRYSTTNNIDNNYYSRNPTQSPVENNSRPTIVLNQAKDSTSDPQINTNVNTNVKVGKIYSSSDSGNIAQSRDAYKNLQEIYLDTPKERQAPKDVVNVVVETVSDGSANGIRRVNPNVERNNNNYENVSPSNEPFTRGVNKYKSNRFDTISAFTTDSQINKLYTQSSPTTKSQYNPVTQRSRNRVTTSTTVSSSFKEEKSIVDKRNEEKLVTAQKISDTKETPKGKYSVRTSRGNIKYVKNPHSGYWHGDSDEKYPPQFSYK